MKNCSLIICFAVIVVSCQKEIRDNNHSSIYLETVKRILKDSLSGMDYNSVDFDRPVISHIEVEGQNIYLVRFPFQHKATGNFILVHTDSSGNIVKGKIIQISRNDDGKDDEFNGSIQINTLHRNRIFKSTIINGYLQRSMLDVTSMEMRENSQADPYVDLPGVVVVGTINSSGGISFSTYMALLMMVGNESGGGYYSNGDPWSGGGGSGGGGGGGTGGGSGSGGVTPTYDNILHIDFETQQADPPIDIAKFMKCFTNIPDNGATGSIEIFSDIPVDGDPSQFFNWQSESPGHVFIQLKKQNGSQSVTQNIGFYPVEGWKTIFSAGDIDGKFVDNAYHDFNAAFKVDLTPAQIQLAVNKILSLANEDYDIDEYNCSDWSLSIFNTAVNPGDRLTIPKFRIPGLLPLSNTPQGLFIKLQEMKAAGGAQAANIVIPLIGSVGQSSGPCN